MTEEDALRATLDHYLAQGERGLDAALLALLETRGEARLAHLARQLGVERALVVRSVYGLAERGLVHLHGPIGPGQRVAPAGEDEALGLIPMSERGRMTKERD